MRYLRKMTIRRSKAVRLLGMTTIIAGVLVASALTLKGKGYPPVASCDRTRECRVLFVGDSYSYVNDLPAVLEGLARAGHHLMQTGLVAGPGESLTDHVASQDARRSLQSAKWDVVVLQEQSQIPASEHLRQTEMYPAALQLVGMIRNAGAQPMFFVTWAESYGWPANGLLDYRSMQSAVDEGYLTIAHGLHAAVAPVGYAWSATLSEERRADRHAGLWRLDGSHPTARGTYLAACVFYAALFRETPIGLSYHAGLLGGEAAKLQGIASEVVLGDSAKWGLS